MHILLPFIFVMLQLLQNIQLRKYVTFTLSLDIDTSFVSLQYRNLNSRRNYTGFCI